MYCCVPLPHHVPTPTRGMTVALTADLPTRALPLPLTRTLWGDQYLYAVAITADHPIRTPTPTLTLILPRALWGNQCLDAVVCDSSRLIRPFWMLCLDSKLIRPALDAVGWKAEYSRYRITYIY